LAALFLPSLAHAKKRAHRVRCIANLHQLALGLHAYLSDNHAYPLYGPWQVALGREGLGYETSQGRIHFDTMKGVWHCPSASWDWAAFPAGWIPSCYAYNGFGLVSQRDPQTLGLGGGNLSGFLAPQIHPRYMSQRLRNRARCSASETASAVALCSCETIWIMLRDWDWRLYAIREKAMCFFVMDTPHPPT
jgi:hypothetical protein